MTYKEALDKIHSLNKFGSRPGLDRVKRLLSDMGNPQDDVKYIHVAGTNGKGSVTAYMTAVCVSACLKTGTFNSPSVFEYNERFLLNGSPLVGGLVAKYFTIVRDTIEKEQARRKEEGLA